MLKIYLIRHGQNADNVAGILNGHRDEPLTAIGLEQASEIAQKIKEAVILFDAVYASPLQRAYVTAEIISKTLSLPKPQKEPLLIERNFGVMTGEKITDIEKLCAPNIIKTGVVTYFLNPKGAETFPDLITRATILLEKIRAQYSNGNILLVTHGDMGKMIYAKYYNLDWKKVLTQFHFGNCDLLLLSPDSPVGETHVFKIIQHNH